MSSVDPAKTNEAGGLQGTAQNLGASLGTALIGSVLIAALTNGFDDIDQNSAVPPTVRDRVVRSPRGAYPSSPSRTSRGRSATRGPLSPGDAIADDYGDAEIRGLKRAIGAVAVFAVLSLWFARMLPGRATAPHGSPQPGAGSAA